MITPEKLQLADDLETALQKVPMLPIGVFGNLSQFLRTLRSPRTVVLVDMTHHDLQHLLSDGFIQAPLPDLGEVK